jgi:hypothetical protein
MEDKKEKKRKKKSEKRARDANVQVGKMIQ